MRPGPVDVLVAGVGNIFLGDDGFGCAVVESLRNRPLPPGVAAIDYGVGGLHLAYDIADGVGRLVLVDAMPVDGEPGGVIVFEAEPGDLEGMGTSTIDAHGMDPATVLRSVRNLGVEPPPTVVIGCRPASTEEGIGLSDAVAASVEPAVRAVLDVVERGTAGTRRSSTEEAR